MRDRLNAYRRQVKRLKEELAGQREDFAEAVGRLESEKMELRRKLAVANGRIGRYKRDENRRIKLQGVFRSAIIAAFKAVKKE